MFYHSFAFALVGFFVYTSIANATMSSANYQIKWDSVSTGGSDTSTSASYTLRDSIDGKAVAGRATSTSYQVETGYRSGIFDEVISFDLFISNSSQRNATNLVGLTVSLADTSGLLVGDYVSILQDIGANQRIGIGKIASIGAGTITLDAIKTDGVALTIDGTGDAVFEMDATAVIFGDFSVSLLSTKVVGFEVSADNTNGYVIQMYEDGNFRSSDRSISDVTDGAVTAGSNEYGARSSDTSLANSTFDTADSAITSTAQEIATSSASVFDERNFLALKVSIDNSLGSGSYGHTVSFIASGNF